MKKKCIPGEVVSTMFLIGFHNDVKSMLTGTLFYCFMNNFKIKQIIYLPQFLKGLSRKIALINMGPQKICWKKHNSKKKNI